MANETYQAAYEASADELESLLEEQEKIEKRILSLRKTMNALAILISEQGGKEATFLDYAHARMRQLIDTTLTGDIHRIVLMADGPLTASEIRDEIKKLGGSLAEHSNPLATIHAITNRLVESGKIKEVTKSGKKAWEKAPQTTAFDAFKIAHEAKLAREKAKAEEERKKLFPQQLGYPDPLNQRGKK